MKKKGLKIEDEEEGAEEYAEDEDEEESDSEHDCGCGVCTARGEKLAAMKGEGPAEMPMGKPHGGKAPGLMIVVGGGPPSGEEPRRRKMLDELVKAKR